MKPLLKTHTEHNSMEPQLAHRLLLQALADAIKVTRTHKNHLANSGGPTEQQLRSVVHFDRCL